jgi:hypothetical protein
MLLELAASLALQASVAQAAPAPAAARPTAPTVVDMPIPAVVTGAKAETVRRYPANATQGAAAGAEGHLFGP